jgi:hypothetical protein
LQEFAGDLLHDGIKEAGAMLGGGKAARVILDGLVGPSAAVKAAPIDNGVVLVAQGLLARRQCMGRGGVVFLDGR